MALKYLPRNYLRIAAVDFSEDKKRTRRLDLAAFGIAVLMTAAGRVFVPFSTILFFGAVTREAVMRVAGILPALLGYIALHTLLRWVLLKKIGKMKPGVGVSRFAPYVSSGAYLSRKEFALEVLLPPAVFAVLFMALDFLLPIRFFWFAYILQIVNVTGAVGDIYTVWYAGNFGEDVLILDGGVFTEFYAKAELVEK